MEAVTSGDAALEVASVFLGKGDGNLTRKIHGTTVYLLAWMVDFVW